MKVTKPPKRFVDEEDGQTVEEVDPDGSRFESIAVKRLEDSIEIKAKKHGTEDVTEFRAELTDELFRGVTVEGIPRRQIDDDIQDVLTLLGYAFVDKTIKEY